MLFIKECSAEKRLPASARCQKLHRVADGDLVSLHTLGFPRRRVIGKHRRKIGFLANIAAFPTGECLFPGVSEEIAGVVFPV